MVGLAELISVQVEDITESEEYYSFNKANFHTLSEEVASCVHRPFLPFHGVNYTSDHHRHHSYEFSKESVSGGVNEGRGE